MAEVHDRSKRQEVKIAKDLGGKRQPASGSRWGYKRDVISEKFLVEAKSTIRKSYRLVLKDLEFLRQQAHAKSKEPIYIVDMAGTSIVLGTLEALYPCVMSGTISSHLSESALTYPMEADMLSANKRVANVFDCVGFKYCGEWYVFVSYDEFLEVAND